MSLRAERIDTALCWCAVLITGLEISFRIFAESVRHLLSAWPDLRLGFSGLLAAGLDLYPPFGAGPLVGDIYGPISAIFYLPPLLAPNITLDVWLAEFWTFLWVGGLIGTACFIKARTRNSGYLLPISITVIGLAVMLAVPGLFHCLIQVHADAPCLVFSTASCIIWRNRARFSLGVSAASAFLWALAVLSKQSALFVLPGQLAAILFFWGVTAAFVHGSIACGLLVLGFFASAAALGSAPSAMWFYLVTVPGHHPFLLKNLILVTTRAHALVVPLLALGAIVWACFQATSKAAGAAIEPSHRYDWLMLTSVALAVAPFSFMSGIKQGGYLNNYHTHYYLLLAACLATLDALGPATRPLKRLVAAGAIASLLLLPSDLLDLAFELKTSLARIDQNTHRVAYDYLKTHQDAYFAWHTLATVEATGRAYHNFDAIRTLELGRYRLSPSEFKRFIPHGVRYVVLPDEGRGIRGVSFYVARLMPDYRASYLRPKELADFMVYTKLF
jgi:hypothetical protein